MNAARPVGRKGEMEEKRKDPPSLRHRCARVEMFTNHSQDRGSDMQLTTYGVDLAKRVFVRPESRVSFCFTGGTIT
jgi:hypothetical protein